MLVRDLGASWHRADLSSEQFSAPDLAEIARELDKDEQRELDEGERAQTSNNMDDTGALNVYIYYSQNVYTLSPRLLLCPGPTKGSTGQL